MDSDRRPLMIRPRITTVITPQPSLLPSNNQRRPLIPDFFGSVFEKFAVSFVTKNYWRVKYYLTSEEDAMSEACVCYYYTRSKYGDHINSDSHFMALYKLVINSWFTKISIKDSRLRNANNSTYFQETYGRVEASEARLIVALGDASEELQRVLALIIDSPAKHLMTILHRDSDQKDETRFFRRAVVAVGIPAHHTPKLKKELIDLLKHSNSGIF